MSENELAALQAEIQSLEQRIARHERERQHTRFVRTGAFLAGLALLGGGTAVGATFFDGALREDLAACAAANERTVRAIRAHQAETLEARSETKSEQELSTIVSQAEAEGCSQLPCCEWNKADMARNSVPWNFDAP